MSPPISATASARPVTPLGLKASLLRLPRFLAFVLRHFLLARLSFSLAILLLLLEYAGFSLMIPLAAAASDTHAAPTSGGVLLAFWSGVAERLGLPVGVMTWLWLFLTLLALRTALGYVHLLLSNWVSKQVHSHLSERTLRRVLVDEPMARIYRRSIGYYVTLAGDDTFKAGTIVNTASQALATLLSALAGFVLLYVFSVPAFMATLVFLGVCAVMAAFAIRAMVRLNGRSVALSRELGTAFIEALNGLRSIRSMGSETFFQRSYAGQISRYVRLLFAIDSIKSGIKFLPAIVALLAAMVVVWPGTSRADQITPGVFFAATLLMIRLFASLGATVNQLSVMLMDLRAATDIDELLESVSHDDGTQAIAATEPLREIELYQVEYGYGPGHKVLDKLNLRLLPGQTVVIMGSSGSGKSTLADLLLGLIRPDAGEVRVNGTTASMSALRHHVILVEQQARIFSTSVRDNLLLGEKYDDETLWRALGQVDLEAHVRNLPGGLSASFDYQGANVSGGQRQRIGIARALIRDPQVLILDEATSALDARTRATVVANLRQIMRNGILIFITHEKTLADDADVVLTLGPSETAPEPAPRLEVGHA